MANIRLRKYLTQCQAIFYRLYTIFKKDKEVYTPIWQLIGEIWCEEVGKWGFISYEVSARMSELYHDNPNLFERRQVVGKTGAKYFAYRLRTGVSVNDIKDDSVLVFYKIMRRNMV